MTGLYYLSKHIYFCDVSDGTIFLDLRTNRYFAIQSHDMLVLGPHVHGFAENHPPVSRASESQGVTSDAIVHRLLANGVLTGSAADGKLAYPVALSIDPHPCVSISLGPLSVKALHVLNFFLSVLHASISIRWSRVGTFLSRHHAAKVHPAVQPTSLSLERVNHLLRIFNYLRLWVYTATDACLLDTLTLVNFLQRYDLPSTVVIGVRTNPFGAHAWAQWDSFVLNDTPDFVKGFRPLLAL
jgi:hypothetical protein